MMTTTTLAIGQAVQLRIAPAQQGVIIEILAAVGGEARYRVFHGAGDLRDYFASQLEVADIGAPDADEQTLLAQQSTADEFVARLAAARLAHPQLDSIYALHASRVKHIPFQFKPLLRLLRADQPRLLIADEVGVGKTIEAGLILKELQSRQGLERVLIVCPKALVAKWRLEMKRFDEDFLILDSAQLAHCLRETHLDGQWPERFSRAIVPLEVMRREEVLRGGPGGRKQARIGLLELDPAPQFDLLIVDEAHHLRNETSLSHETVKFLSEQSVAVVFLSATPVQVGARNLFSLLTLLRPDLFPDHKVLAAMVTPNRFLTTAMQIVRRQQPADQWQAEAASNLAEAAATEWGLRVLRPDARFTTWAQRLQQPAALTAAERVQCIRDLEELHSLAHVMNRTRRRDIGRFTIREPHTIAVRFTPAQQLLYTELIAFRHDVIARDHDPRIARLVTDTLERQASSSLPALVPMLDRVLNTQRLTFADVSDDVEQADDDAAVRVDADLLVRAAAIRELATALPPEDPKRDQLVRIVAASMEPGAPGKLLVFSFFLHTLAYLEQQLRAFGVRVATISGTVDDVERESLRARFRLPRAEPNAIDVLLSSEVGCEGLDYEFCDRLVNYDIPWNPMRIEQRIGRIDRFGQQAPKVQIFNFVTEGTVEERIFFRCFERLGVFRDTVGDHEEVLGELAESLATIALDRQLTPAQADEQVRQVADNALRVLDEQRRLESASADLLGLDQLFLEEVNEIEGKGRFVSPAELQRMIRTYLAQPGIQGTLQTDAGDPRLVSVALSPEGRATLLREARALSRQNRVNVDFMRWLGDSESPTDPYLVTFDQELATERRDLVFVNPLHPLATIAARYWETTATPFSAYLTITTAALPAGRYGFVCDAWTTLAVKANLELQAAAWHIDTQAAAPITSAELIEVLQQATSLHRVTADHAQQILGALPPLDELLYRQREGALRDVRERNAMLVTRRLASLDVQHTARLDLVDRELASAVNPRIQRMRRAERARLVASHQRLTDELMQAREVDILQRRIALGYLEVRHAN